MCRGLPSAPVKCKTKSKPIEMEGNKNETKPNESSQKNKGKLTSNASETFLSLALHFTLTEIRDWAAFTIENIRIHKVDAIKPHSSIF